MNDPFTRRRLLQGAVATASLALLDQSSHALETAGGNGQPLQEFGYGQIRVTGRLQTAQRENVTEVLMGLSPDSLLQPFRQMAGQPAPGQSLGGWYEWKPDYNYHHDAVGLAPGANFGQWTSSLARLDAASSFGGSTAKTELAERVTEVHGFLSQSLAPAFFAQTRFPGYSLDKLVCGLMDGHRLIGDTRVFDILDQVIASAQPSLPGRAIDRDVQWKPGADLSWMWDETYTLPENLYLAAQMGAGSRCRRMADAYLLDETYFEPLSRGVNVLGDKHAYSYVNALCSAMQAFFVGGSTMHLQAAKNGFDLLGQQSFVTGGWGPDELLRKPGYDEVAKSLVSSRNGFETPCGSYAHMKLTRYLLRATGDGRYGDSMECVLHNTVLGALPLQADGRSFYSSDYSQTAKRVYSVHRWPCCSGTLPQVVADYGINTYLREPRAVWVVLYQPSELRWIEAARAMALEQSGNYPEDGSIRLRVTAERPTSFALRLRIPAWAGSDAKLQVNGRPAGLRIEKGFTSIDRVWRTGDTVELDLPMSLRLESLPSDGVHTHADVAALLRGPLVLFALREAGETGPLTLARKDLLEARQTGAREWMSGSRRFVPFTEVGESFYSTYFQVT